METPKSGLGGLYKINLGEDALSLAKAHMDKYAGGKERDPNYSIFLHLDIAEINLQIAEDQEIDTSAQRERLDELRKHQYPDF
jgi:hypothetical protein